MRLRHIEIFDAICRTGSLTEAAASLHITQPAASKMLAHAEAQLGFKLFERVKGRLHATREAEILAPQVARLNQELTSVRRLASSLRHSQQGHLRVGSSPALGFGLLPLAISRSRAAQPHITFDVHTHHSGELVDGLLARELDLIVTFGQAEHPGVSRKQIGRTELMHVGARSAHPCKVGPVPLKALAQRDFIALEARDPAGAVLQQALDEAGVELNIVVQVQTHYVAFALAELGCGDAIVDLITGRAMMRPALALSRLEPALYVPISVMTHVADPLSALHRSFIDQLGNACTELELGATETNLFG